MVVVVADGESLLSQLSLLSSVQEAAKAMLVSSDRRCPYLHMGNGGDDGGCGMSAALY